MSILYIHYNSFLIVLNLHDQYENWPMQYEENLFKRKKRKKFTGKRLIILLKTLITGTCVSVLTCTHSLCFGSKIRKLGIPLQTPVVLLYKSGCKGKYISWIYFLEVCINESNQFKFASFCPKFITGIKLPNTL